MQSKMSEYEKSPEGPNKAHFKALQSFEGFWSRKSTYSPVFCLACSVAPSQIVIPCKHSLCELCYRNFCSPIARSESLLTICSPLVCETCPLGCSQPHWDSFKVLLPPPTASARTLCLDGGGVKAVVMLQVLAKLLDLIGLDTPLQTYFDFICGTSAG